MKIGVITITELSVARAKKAAEGVRDLHARFHPACIPHEINTSIIAMTFIERIE